MNGFGQKQKKSRNTNSKKLNGLSANKIKELAINFHALGKLAKAEKYYLHLLDIGIDDPDIISNYALICEQTKRLTKAKHLYEQCIRRFPNHSISACNLSYIYLTNGNLDKAEELINKVIDRNPKLINAYNNLGLICKEKGEIKEAISNMQKAIELDKNFIDAKINLAIILRDIGNNKRAKKELTEAIKLNSNRADIFLNLGTILKEEGLIEDAEAATRKALSLDSDIADANRNLAVILKEKGNIKEAIFHARKETEISPDNSSAYILIYSILCESDISIVRRELVIELICLLLDRKDIEHVGLFKIISEFVLKEHLNNIEKLKGMLIQNEVLERLINDNIISKALKLLPFADIRWERILTQLRKELLVYSIEHNFILSKKITNFISALAQNCYLNEYVFELTDDEINMLADLKINLSINNINDAKIAILACYIPLIELNKVYNLVDSFVSKNLNINELLDIQFKEPIHESMIEKTIRSVDMINDTISKAVKIQYEDNPYPRWRYTSSFTSNQINIFAAINSEITPNKIESNVNKTNYKVLIAGCGTGLQVMDALRYQNASITAIDLSKASLCYAKRKTQEIGVNNIDFIQMDILNLDKLNQKFDLIECSGVLHHMRSPNDGLKKLINVLDDDGFIKLGLYSKNARTIVNSIRQSFRESEEGISNNGIRCFRNRIMRSNYKDFYEITKWSDFYTMSMFRDLCLHVQEYQFHISELINLITSNNLEFLGFVIGKDIKESYQEFYSNDQKQIELLNWINFEEIKPDTFKAMYQFWVKKRNITS